MSPGGLDSGPLGVPPVAVVDEAQLGVVVVEGADVVEALVGVALAACLRVAGDAPPHALATAATDTSKSNRRRTTLSLARQPSG